MGLGSSSVGRADRHAVRRRRSLFASNLCVISQLHRWSGLSRTPGTEVTTSYQPGPIGVDGVGYLVHEHSRTRRHERTRLCLPRPVSYDLVVAVLTDLIGSRPTAVVHVLVGVSCIGPESVCRSSGPHHRRYFGIGRVVSGKGGTRTVHPVGLRVSKCRR